LICMIWGLVAFDRYLQDIQVPESGMRSPPG
jgi:hypothetical protein